MKKLYSPTRKRDFIWVARYSDGTYLSEFDFKTEKQNEFYNIQKEKLINFGLIGHGYNFNFDTVGGVFDLSANETKRNYSFGYLNGNKKYVFNLMHEKYDDLIIYRSAYNDINLLGGLNVNNPTIYQYNFGYKRKLKINGVTFNFQVVCHIPFDEPIYFSFKVVPDIELNGHFAILKNEQPIEMIEAPVKKGYAGKLNWIVR